MKYQFAAFFTLLPRKFCSLKTWLPMLLLPLLVLGCLHFLPAEERTAPVQVGIVYPESGADGFRNALEARSGTVVTFVEADEDTIRGKVATGQWDCGLLPAEDFDERVQAGNWKRLFTVITGEASTAYPLVMETVSSCMAEVASPMIAWDYLEDSRLLQEETKSFAEELLSEALTEEDRILIQLETPDGEPLAAMKLADHTLHSILRGIIAIVALIWLLFSAMDLGRWLESPAAKRLRPLRPVTALLLPRALTAAVPVGISAAAALCLLPEGTQDLLPLAAYLLALTGLSVLLGRFRRLCSALPYLLSFVPVICLLVCPVFVDLSLFFPQLTPIQSCIPVTMFLRAQTLPLLAVCLLALLLSALTDLLFRNR